MERTVGICWIFVAVNILVCKCRVGRIFKQYRQETATTLDFLTKMKWRGFTSSNFIIIKINFAARKVATQRQHYCHPTQDSSPFLIWLQFSTVVNITSSNISNTTNYVYVLLSKYLTGGTWRKRGLWGYSPSQWEGMEAEVGQVGDSRWQLLKSQWMWKPSENGTVNCALHGSGSRTQTRGQEGMMNQLIHRHRNAGMGQYGLLE